jgi:hypothetical protein
MAWAVALGLVLAALGLQVAYAEGIRRCVDDNEGNLVLCQGPLDAWVGPLTLLAVGVLLAIGLWLILARALGRSAR